MMNELEKAVATALRLNSKASELLLPEIKRNIATARAELIRSGCTNDLINSNVELVEDCIICWCLSAMGEEDSRAWYLERFKYQQDNLRKS